MSIDPTKYADPNYFKVSLKTPMAIAIGGGTDCRKKQFCEALCSRLNKKYHTKVAILSLTQFYRELTPEERIRYEAGEFLSDHPSKFIMQNRVVLETLMNHLANMEGNLDAFDFDLLEKALTSLLSGKPTEVPEWDSSTHSRKGTRVIDPVDVILVEGIFILYQKEIRDLMFMKVFIDEDSDERLARRVRKQKVRNGKVLTIKEVLMEYVDRVKPMYEEFILPSKKFADIVVPRGVENTVALQVMSNRIEEYLASRTSSSTTTPGSVVHEKEKIVNPGAAEILAQNVNSSYKNIPK